MVCLLAIIALAFPRIALLILFFFTRYVDRAFHGGRLVPLLGFIFLPITTLVYTWLVNAGYPMDGIYLVALIVAVIIDVGSWGGLRRRG